MNAVILAVLVMVGLSLARVSVVFALVAGALVGGLFSGLSLTDTLGAFNDGVGGGAKVALAYATLGAFAVALSRSGLPDLLAARLIGMLNGESTPSPSDRHQVRLAGQRDIGGDLVPEPDPCPHRLHSDPDSATAGGHEPPAPGSPRCRLCLTFGLTAPYMLLPVGFGSIFLNDILLANINEAGQAMGLEVTRGMVPMAMAIPVGGMFLGLLTAVFVSYRKPRDYANREIKSTNVPHHTPVHAPSRSGLIMAGVAIIAALGIQLYSGSMILGGLVGFAISLGGLFKWNEADDLFTSGMRMMALIGFIMISAAGFASVMKATGDIQTLVDASFHIIGDNKPLAALVMLMVGLFITLGIGSSFSTIPIIAAIYVPLALQFGFSPWRPSP